MTDKAPLPVLQRLHGKLKQTIRSWIGSPESASRSPHHPEWKHAATLPPPQVPSRLREMLKDHPALVQEIQYELIVLVGEMVGGPNATPPFERVVWMFEDMLGAMAAHAGAETLDAYLWGDSEAGELADERTHLLGRVLTTNPWNDEDEGNLRDYFRTFTGAFQR